MKLRFLEDKWDEAAVSSLDAPELLRYRSNLLGSDLSITNFGGGNTSSKIDGIDPVNRETVSVLWVKGSGGDLGSIERSGFATLYLDRLLSLEAQYTGVSEEDAMVALYPLVTFNNNPVAASIDTPAAWLSAVCSRRSSSPRLGHRSSSFGEREAKDGGVQ